MREWKGKRMNVCAIELVNNENLSEREERKMKSRIDARMMTVYLFIYQYTHRI
jgi:hypothetical protein